MPKATLDRLRALFPQALPYLMYGLTEAFRSTYLDPAEIDRRPDSIGKAIPNAEILVVRPDGSPCDPGEHGELVHRGPLVAMGYWNDPARTAERFRPAPGRDASWRAPEIAVFSGDTVVTDEEGFLFFVGRRDEMIKTSGYRVSPTEIEEVAYATGLVRDAVALGVEDPALGQRIVLIASAIGQSPLDAPALLAAFKRQLPQYMVPSSVVEMAAIPTTPNGKFDRVLLREQLAFVSSHPTMAMFGVAGDHLAVGGIPIDRLAERVGSTPFFAYDRQLITSRVDLLRSVLPAGIHLSYAVKANPMPAVVQHLAGLVDACDVASALEMKTALDTGMPASQISFAGPGKTTAELTQAIAAGVTIEMESPNEAARVVEIGNRLGIRPRVALRVNPDFQVKGSGMRMGGGPQQFGIDVEEVPSLLRKLAVGRPGVSRISHFCRIAEPSCGHPVRGAGQERRSSAETRRRMPVAGSLSQPWRRIRYPVF